MFVRMEGGECEGVASLTQSRFFGTERDHRKHLTHYFLLPNQGNRGSNGKGRTFPGLWLDGRMCPVQETTLGSLEWWLAWLGLLAVSACCL